MRAMVRCVLVTLWMAGTGCDGSGSSADAAIASDALITDAEGPHLDAGPGDAAPLFGVRCGDEVCSPTTTQGCCDTPPAAPVCQAIGPSVCAGDLTSCDGVEDCLNPGDACCSFQDFGASCTIKGDCTKKQGGLIICHYDEECSAEAPNCCNGSCTDLVCI